MFDGREAADTLETTTDQDVFELDQLFRLNSAYLYHQLRAIARYDRKKAWAEDAMSCMEDWIGFRFGYSRETALKLVKVARTLESLPAIGEALKEGSLSFDKVVDLCSFVKPEDDEEWSRKAQHMNAARVKMFAQQSRRITQRDAEQAVEERRLEVRWDARKAEAAIWGRIPGADGKLIYKTFEYLTQKAGPDENGVWPPSFQADADALIEMCHSVFGETQHTERATVVVHVDARELNYINGRAFLDDGELIPSETARRLACDGYLELVVDGFDGGPIGVGRKMRIVPAWQYRLLKKRDLCCVVNGCTRTKGLQAHHIIHFAHGGLTDLDNLVLVCPFHHRKVHDEGFRLVWDAEGRLRMVRPDGRPVMGRPDQLRPEVRERMLGPSHRRPLTTKQLR